MEIRQVAGLTWNWLLMRLISTHTYHIRKHTTLHDKTHRGLLFWYSLAELTNGKPSASLSSCLAHPGGTTAARILSAPEYKAHRLAAQ